MYDIDFNGTHNVLESVAEADTQHVVAVTSVTAYGAHPDNPAPLTEEHPVRGVAGFSYARDKTESDRTCRLWTAQHPDRVMTIVRPCTVFGRTSTTISYGCGPSSASWSTSATSTTGSSSSTRTSSSRPSPACS